MKSMACEVLSEGEKRMRLEARLDMHLFSAKKAHEDGDYVKLINCASMVAMTANHLLEIGRE